MKISSIIASSAALALCAAPAMAAPPAPAASKLSLSSSARVGAPAGRSKLAGGGGIFAVLILAGVAAIVGVAISKDDDSDSN